MDKIKKVKEWREKSNKQFRLFNVEAAFRISDDKFFQTGDRIITTNNEEHLYKKGMRGVIVWFYHDFIGVVVRFDNELELYVQMNDMDWN